MVRAWVVRDDDSSDEDSGVEDLESSQPKNALTSLFQKASKPHLPLGIKRQTNTKAKESHRRGSISFPKRRPSSAHFRRSADNSVDDLSDTKRCRSASQLRVNDVSPQIESFVPTWQKEALSKTVEPVDIDKRLNIKPDIRKASSPGALYPTKSPVDSGPAPAMAKIVNTARTVDKFKTKARRHRFNFDKFLSYLESMRSVVGFTIAGIMVTWDLVSTTLFFLFSVIAVFVQESIFGSQRATI